MRVAVTGSSGLVGRALVEALTSRGDAVTLFVRPNSPRNAGRVVLWDPSSDYVDRVELRDAGGFDAVVHLAGAGIGDRRWSPARKAAIRASRVRSTTLLARVLADLPSGVALLVSASAIGWYGSRGDETLDESASAGRGFLSDVCRQWEEAASRFAPHGRVAYLRSGLVVSTRGGVMKAQLPLFRFGLGGQYSSGTQWMSPISLNDEVRAILWIIDHQIAGPVNLTAPEPLTNRAFTRTLARELHRPAFFNVPKSALRVVLGDEMASELVLASQRAVPKVLHDSGFAFEQPDAASALQWALSTRN